MADTTTLSAADIQTALANEARRQELRTQVASLQGGIDATASLLQRISSLNNDSQQQLTQAQATLAAFEAGAGPGITDDFGPKSSIDIMIEAEREAAKSAVVTYIKANPTCVLADASTAWNTAALASHPTFTTVIQDPATMASLYGQNLVGLGLITANTWENFRDWVVATDPTVIEGF